ncbi:hypothetical protein AXK57_15090 [Tsukamurella pulmonis]|uniref:NhaP-type Na+/H+ or K+/H+ antiporter n=1 Tax=Tsukamurella pulmonis TaxID=47312 RepID=A0A1H1DEN3_9ACTN|nr:cation:proton antiporter [Tsukamurella pulmonis]KXO92371.1 hypothetical protein AXK56_04705 [Tsukamurella pulmonis]KXP09117.1 hypothetical protein AXK57_15090 [Tsukamurella pulmonis]SDQ74719.1 NhaP-type Na+/H+ or K+/H+ antiporter [Tsukamurella pulmonis]SUP22155.1 potassium/proton antiporter [Tsukamurella pulmonis]
MIPATLVAAATFLLWCLLSGRMDRWGVSAPLVMVLAGGAVGIGAHGAIAEAINTGAAQRAAEIILAVLLFVDATHVRGSLLGRHPRLAARSLLLGIPVGLILSVAVGWLLLPHLGWSVLLLVACVIAPIDFASAPALLRDRRVPSRVRDVLTVESGYTDGLITPVFLFAMYWAGPAHGGDDDPAPALLAAAPQAAIALAVGAALGAAIAAGVRYSERTGLATASGRSLAIAATPLLTYAAAVGLGGNGFVAAFVCGIVYRLRRGTETADDVGLTDDVGFLLAAAMWFVFGSVAIVGIFDGVDWRTLVFVLAALTVLRVVPVGVAMLGSGLPRRQVLGLGWLRPRGTSTIVFALIAFNTLPDGPVADLTLTVAVLVVLGSVVLHTVGVPVTIAGHDRRVRSRA